ncbi:uncharacterized protein DFL_009674 [Arthrobotrys flagrans]|uniref:Uncharacterized protein n=1 Tax=Arthrobotrys flagrans TaxID=97331 RepID=A0A436ZSB5_ARTFL|nr:hypothetical protein DFL_009674 [Arthrobotrys flagrans]
MAPSVDQIPITNSGHLRKLRETIDEGLRTIPSQLDEDSIDWKAKLKEILDDIYKLCCDNWTLLEFILFTAGAAISIPLILQIAGFSLVGPVAGSYAAAWQASIGNVAAGSFFAFLQSIGMAPATATVTGALIGIGIFVWVELNKVHNAPPPDDGVPGGGTPPSNADKSGVGRRILNPLRSLYDGYRVVRYGFNSKTRFRG